MTTFKANKTDFKPVLFRSVIFIVGAWIVFGILYFIIQGHMVTDNYYWVASVTLIISVYDTINEDRLYELSFDYESRQIYFFYKSIFSKPKQKKLSFDEARLEIVKTKPIFTKVKSLTKVYFLKRKMEVFEISESKDGFSMETIQDICKTVESIQLPVLKV
jgi:hypothetical protein